MSFLKQKATGSRQNIVELYRDKQIAWAKERSAWDTAKIEAASKAFLMNQLEI